jgi:DNA-binding NarL/FixJ family response regulator
VAEQARAIDGGSGLVADLLSFVQIYRHPRPTEACRGVRGSGANHPTADNRDVPPRKPILVKRCIGPGDLLGSRHTPPHGRHSTGGRAVVVLVTRPALTSVARCLDQVLTLVSTGEVSDPWVVGQAGCAIVSACERATDLARVEAWMRIVGSGTAENEVLLYFTHCRAVYGTMLFQAGRWAEAETALCLGVGGAEVGNNALQRSLTRAALAALAPGEWPLLRAGLQLELARALSAIDRAAAVAEAKSALAAFDRLGAPEAEDASALLRGLGVIMRPSQPPPSSPLDQLSPREREVIDRSACPRPIEPGDRRGPVVSRKTVEHHVSSILNKLGLRSRAEAAVYAVTVAGL